MREIRATSSNAIILKTKNNFSKFYSIFEICIKFCIFGKKGSAWWLKYFGSYWLEKMCLPECQLALVSEHSSRVYMFTGTKHYWYLHGRTFIIIFHYSKTNWVGKYLSESDAKCYDSLLRRWRPITCILLIVERNSCNEFKRNYLRNQKQGLKALLHLWNLHEILHRQRKKNELDSSNILEVIDFEKYASLNAEKALFSEDLSRVKVFTGPKHCSNLRRIVFILIFH